MSENKQFPITFEAYCKEHPEKFEERTNKIQKIIYGVLTALCGLIVIFPSILADLPGVSLFPKWMLVTVGVIGGLICLIVFLAGCSSPCNVNSGGEIKHIGLKKFDRANTDPNQIIAALEKHDFDFLADAAETSNDPLQLYVYEDALGKEFYLHLRAYSAPGDFSGASDVVTVCGQEYDMFRTSIRSIHPVKQ